MPTCQVRQPVFIYRESYAGATRTPQMACFARRCGITELGLQQSGRSINGCRLGAGNDSEPLGNISSNRKWKRGVEKSVADDNYSRKISALRGCMSRSIR